MKSVLLSYRFHILKKIDLRWDQRRVNFLKFNDTVEIICRLMDILKRQINNFYYFIILNVFVILVYYFN